ncbi:olfactomedin-like protein 3A [Ictalurus punctatus]|uniref:Olfactomedin-like protein 3A n=1 Tax=Ictalurus punctatus TaxID=7998 RepID=A0A2D0RJB6_ICTPU|nr:olfactomedin-like protein 3A [Ictalurus punctatus]
MFLKLLVMLFMSLCAIKAQRSTQDVFMMEYFQRRILEMEERLISCNQDLQSMNQRMYDMSAEMRGQVRSVNVLKSEIEGYVDSLATRVDRVERDVEYLHTKLPDTSSVEISDSLLDQQVKEAQSKRKAVIIQGKECSTRFSGIKSQKIVKKAGDVVGSWLKDPTVDSSKIYFFSGSRNNTLLQFGSLKSFTDSNSTTKHKVIQLPRPWQGTGHAVYDGFVYYHNADTRNEVLKVSLVNRTVADRMLLPAAGRIPTYGLAPHTFLDFAVDELGLWVIHADPDFGGNLVITKLDSRSLSVEHTWDTTCKSHNAEGAFIVCGTMYVVYNSHSGGRSSIQCLFDIHDSVWTEELPVMYFPKRYSSHSSMHYHPQDKQIYAWDDGYQTMYQLDVKKKLQVT